ncbi:MAG: YeeE/YedE family protein [Cellvibrionaceae bacterium]
MYDENLKMIIESFSLPILGGIFIGIAATLMLLLLGRICGVSGIYWGAFSAGFDRLWRWAFVIGLPIGAFLFHLLSQHPTPLANSSYPLAILGGLCVGVGVKLGSGCTSGHGVCGIARLSARSIIATLTFMAAGILTVFIVRHIFQ